MLLKSDAEQEKDMGQDTEITLGTGKLLGIFFGLVLVCGAFFTLGYMLGHSTASAGAATQIIGTAAPSGSSAGKPSAVNSKVPETTIQNCAPGSANCTPPANGPDSSFVNAVSGKTPNTQLTPDTSQPTAVTTSTTSPQPASTNPTGTAGPYMVQVAAVSKQEDAELLVNALRKKQYPVFSSTVAGDAFYHVQVGPFNDIKEAEAMRTRLAGDGYNAIVKK
ncbi:MAG TPA: SPOR domain-containing protein [Candidatus Saccharimonadales bacterium]|jgi:DedD protein|nr:SPOR domain-containing protein [Candidatus Saccharimonadales bacterium]